MPKKRKKQKKRSRLHREDVARVALELIDQEGSRALSMRRVAAKLEVDPMALYRVVPDRDGLTRDIVELMLREVDTESRPGEPLRETAHRLAASEREMALRHPQAYSLVAMAPTNEDPALSHAHRVKRLMADGGLSEAEFLDLWVIFDAWTTGFLLLETSVTVRETLDVAKKPLEGPQHEWAAKMTGTISERAFFRGLDDICSRLPEAIDDNESAVSHEATGSPPQAAASSEGGA